MIELSNIAIPLGTLDGTVESEKHIVEQHVLKKYHLTKAQVASFELRRRSIDARKKSDVHLMFTVRIALVGGKEKERAFLRRLAHHRQDRNVRTVDEVPPRFPQRHTSTLDERPIVVGAGCAGLFCALTLAEAGLSPLLIERGDDAERRTARVSRFNETGLLDTESNIQFGLGGAGTFSDGKLQTGTKSPLHRLILETFVEAGAPERILWDAKPHVGSDILPHVVTNIVHRIEEAGGEVRFRCRLDDIYLAQDGSISGIHVTQEHEGIGRGEDIAAHEVVLACGHSARDVFELLQKKQVTLERKTFAMGARIEHLQAQIDKAQYGPAAGHPALGAAPYKLVSHLPSGRSAFSFCMCPGGYVVAAASEEGGVCTNGMSLSDRAGTNANAGILANVFPEDLPGDDPLAGLSLQRSCERKAFELGGGAYQAPAQLVGDFLKGQPSSAAGTVQPTYPRGVTWGTIEPALPPYIAETLRAAIPQMGKHLKGFDAADAVLTGVETRSSSPVRVVREKDGQSVSTRGLWPCGEGAGYAGGIMSAAADGISCAEHLIREIRE